MYMIQIIMILFYYF